ncbi:glutathione peroxidase [Alkalibacillus haloalkaliphilus]|uniref:glutathione peroxidase n=1 Tax=Alkalibacillus haloalkaliphilus TaxID=94136 RepID=UPI002935627B|nr:glutathione peroxidase [Alkalibacillus haloalkaliphilus]MDV2582327.1 glutathione peroxidase [Alkalibacillus haloalkaliphilus]
MSELYKIEVEQSNGSQQSMMEYEGKVLLIVNTASKCGFTSQFEGLQHLYEKYENDGFEILGFPCDQFMNQEFSEQGEIESFCKLNYGVTFPIYKKVDVKGDEQSNLFQFLTSEKKGFLGGEIKWNFTKFLVDQDGKVIRRYPPQTTPAKIESDIINLIKK